MLEREEGGGGGEREAERQIDIDVKEKHQSVDSSRRPNQDSTHNLGVCPDWELNLQPFGVWDDVPTNLSDPAIAK